MAHWADTYVGRAYTEGDYDCAALVADVLISQFGREVTLPADRPHDPAAAARLIDALREDCASRIESPIEGCAVLLRRGRLARPWHIGVYFERGGEGCVLHSLRETGAIITRLRDLDRMGYQIEGYYQWN